MHVLFVHRNFPAQFGQVAGTLAREYGWRSTFVNERAQGDVLGVRLLKYTPRGGATAQTHAFARTFENAVAHAEGVYRALEPLTDLAPDVIVGHSGFGSTALLPELFDAPIVNYFEYYYRTQGGDADFRPDFPPDRDTLLRARMRNAMILLDLATCARGYSPTEWQRSRFPTDSQSKIDRIHDGIDTGFWSRATPADGLPTRTVLIGTLGARTFAAETKVITYVARGFEAMRGFDIFVRAAKRILAKRSDVVIVAVGEDKSYYGGDEDHIGGTSFLKWSCAGEPPDPERFLLPGRMAPDDLARLLAMSDVHIYLTVPFVLSWSLLNAMSSECAVLASDTAPVAEFIEDGVNGVLTDFFDGDGFADRALELLDDEPRRRTLGAAARRTVVERASLDQSVLQLKALFERVVAERGR